MPESLLLGSITCPSGQLVVADTGYLALWSGQKTPKPGEFLLSQIRDPQVRASVLAAADFDIVGADAEQAARGFNRQAGRWLYDIPAHGRETIQQSFADHCAEYGLDASLRESPHRVPHRERADRAAARGGEEFIVHGVPVVALGDLPTDRACAVTVTLRDFGGRVGVQWETVTVHVREGLPAETRRLGRAGVDWARLILADADGLGLWQHEKSIDGLADVAFWGLSSPEAAEAFSAGPIGLPGEDGVHGWRDLGLEEALSRAVALENWQRADPQRRIMVDFRPHSHHWQVMAQVRGSQHGTGHIELGGARMLCLVTGEWGDGFYPVHTTHDAQGRLLDVRIVLGDEEQ